MQILKNYKNVALYIYAVFGSCKSGSNSDNENSLVSNNHEQSSNLSSDSQIEDMNNNESSKSENIESCVICQNNLPKLKKYELSDPLFYMNGLYKCPNGDNGIYHFECILQWSKESSTCPLRCKGNLQNNIKTYKKSFIELLFREPKKEMIETLKSLLQNFNEHEVLEEIFRKGEVKHESCEKILEWTKKSEDKNIENFRATGQASLQDILLENFRKILFKYTTELKNQKISTKNFLNFVERLKNGSEKNIWTILYQNYETIIQLTLAQIEKLFSSGICFVFSDNILSSRTGEFFSDEFLKKIARNQSECFIISTIFSKIISSEKSLELFFKLNSLSLEYDSHCKEMLFDNLCDLFNRFKTSFTFYKAIKVLGFSVYDLINKLKSFNMEYLIDIVLGNDYDSLKEWFEYDIIIEVIKKSIAKPSTVKASINFYFENKLYEIDQDKISQVSENFCKYLENEYYDILNDEFYDDFDRFHSTDVLEDFFKKIFDNNLFELLEKKVVAQLIYYSIRLGANNDLLKTLEKYAQENLFEIISQPIFVGRTDLLFNLMKKFSSPSKKPFEHFDLSSTFYLEQNKLATLCRILGSKDNIYDALKTICKQSKLFNNFTIDSREMLKNLIFKILELEEKEINELFEILINRLPEEFCYLIKLYIIDYFDKHAQYSPIKKYMKNREKMIKYLKSKVKKTPLLKLSKKNKDFDMLKYYNSGDSSLEQLYEFKINLEETKISKLLKIYYKRFHQK